MAIFSYWCEACGEFDLSRKIAERDRNVVCPACGGPARRLLSAPHLNTMGHGMRQAAIINERSGDAPRIIRSGDKKRSMASGKPLHLHNHEHPVDGQAAKRPWQIGH